jgi:hypothetical protein
VSWRRDCDLPSEALEGRNQGNQQVDTEYSSSCKEGFAKKFLFSYELKKIILSPSDGLIAEQFCYKLCLILSNVAIFCEPELKDQVMERVYGQ